ncbi:hypothetical protein GCM10010492_76780 [Saccharothrix mutabilis subsp. mutabilis]|uniref:Beta-lactamase class A catalytic domain-containing protein n=1 Tax=Saccharothrix mutabilis subsp. mutabilis TaxID=66855 RepID=A0ABP3EK85_9PSEU
MPVTRRALLTAFGGTLLFPAVASASTAWSGVSVVVDDGRGGRFAHRAHEPRPLGSAVRVVHLAGYARAVSEGSLSPAERVRVAEWERFRSAPDAHGDSLRHLGIRSTNGVVADDPRVFVTLADLAGVLTRFDDHAAADLLRQRLGEARLRAAAARLGWPDAPVPSLLGERLRQVLGRPEDPARYLTDPALRLEVLGRSPAVPARPPSTRGAAADLHRLLRNLDHPLDISGSAVALRTHRHDGRVGTAVVLADGDSAEFARVATLVRSALHDPAVLREFHVTLT